MNLDLPDLPRALCAQVGPNDAVFFPEKGAVGHQASAAKTMCGRCPEQNACLQYALARPDIDGMWGGTTFKERVRWRSRARVRMTPQSSVTQPRRQPSVPRELQPCGTPAGYRRHQRLKEKACAECKQARNAYKTELARRGEVA